MDTIYKLIREQKRWRSVNSIQQFTRQVLDLQCGTLGTASNGRDDISKLRSVSLGETLQLPGLWCSRTGPTHLDQYCQGSGRFNDNYLLQLGSISYLQVERVISNFYYRRAGWNIVERKLAFPDEPLPDPAFLRRDFETCVLEGKTIIDDYSDHNLTLQVIQNAATSRIILTPGGRLETTGGRWCSSVVSRQSVPGTRDLKLCPYWQLFILL